MQEDSRMSGWVKPGYEPVQQLFASMLEEDADYSAGVCAYIGGKKVLDLVGGPHLKAGSLVPVFSSTKGAIGICIALLVERGQLDLDAPVSQYWQEFAGGGKQYVTVRQLLSHQAGLINVDGGFSLDEVLEHTRLAERLAAQRPFWHPGAARGYHAITLGLLADELVRRITGKTLAAFYETEIRRLTDADFFVGVPETALGRIVPVLPQSPPRLENLTPEQRATAEQFMQGMQPGTLAGLAFNVARSDFPQNARDRWCNPDVWRVGPPASGGVATAAGLAQVYASAIGEVDGARLLSRDTVATVSQIQTFGPDVLMSAGPAMTVAFGIVFQKPDARLQFGSYRSFGHDGAGGSLAFADPEYELAFGYVPVRIASFGDRRPFALAEAVRRCMTL